MLGPEVQFGVWQDSGVSISQLSLQFRGWKYAADGSVEWGAWQELLANATLNSTASDAATATSIYDNSTTKYIGGEVQFGITGNGSAAGSFNVEQYRRSQAATTPGGAALTKGEAELVMSRTVPTTAINIVVLMPID